MNKKYFECELLVSTATDPYTIKPVKELAPGPGLDAIRAGDVFAEVNIPMNLAEADYCYVCFLVEVPAWKPAIVEILTLKVMVEDIHERFSKYAKEVNTGIDDELSDEDWQAMHGRYLNQEDEYGE